MTQLTRKALVDQAIAFGRPERVPVVFWNCDQTEGDLLLYHLALGAPGDGSVNAWDWHVNEWGYRLEAIDGTMGHPVEPVYSELPRAADIRVPALREAERMSAAPAFFARCEDRYRLASFDLSGFTVYTLLRGFDNAMQDFLLEPDGFAVLMDCILDFECELMRMAARHGFHGIHFADDWGTQSGLMISPRLWRQLFKPRYARQFASGAAVGPAHLVSLLRQFPGHRRGFPRDWRRRAEYLSAQRDGHRGRRFAVARPPVFHDADQLPDGFHSRHSRRDLRRSPAAVPTAWHPCRRFYWLRRAVQRAGHVARKLSRLRLGFSPVAAAGVSNCARTRCRS